MTAQRTVVDVEGTQMTQRTSLLKRVLSADFLIAAVLLVVFVAAFLGAQDWPFRTRLFPVLVTSGGAALALLKMALSLRPKPQVAEPEAHRLGDVELTDEDEADDRALEYVFESASRRDWLRALGWAAVFFLGLLLFGALVTVVVFTLLYLLLEARSSVVVALVYTVVLTGILYSGQSQLNVSLPPGILFS